MKELTWMFIGAEEISYELEVAKLRILDALIRHI